MLGINLTDFTGNIFKRLLDGPKRYPRGDFRADAEKEKSLLTKRSGRDTEYPKGYRQGKYLPVFMYGIIGFVLLLVPLGSSCLGISFWYPSQRVGFMFLPFWYIKLTASHFKKGCVGRTGNSTAHHYHAYLRSEDILTSVEENLEYLNPPVKNIFQDFVSKNPSD